MPKPIADMTMIELRNHENDLWATYHSTKLQLGGCWAMDTTGHLRLIGHVQRRRKELRDKGADR